MKIFFFALVIGLPFFAHAADPCLDIKTNFIGTFATVVSSNYGPTERDIVEVTKWPDGLIFTVMVNGIPQQQYHIEFGEGSSKGHPTCLLSIGQAVLTSTFVDAVKGHFSFTGMNARGPFKMEATRIGARLH